MSAEALLSRLEKPKATGRGSWVCRCPAHQDKSPSMTIRELDDGRVLVHCFAGCGAADILGAIGLEFDVLFPPKPAERLGPVRRPFPAGDVLEAIAFDLLAAQQLVATIERDGKADIVQRQKLAGIAGRIERARELANG
jgi:hypothetical protein